MRPLAASNAPSRARSGALAGIALMIAGIFLFAVNDVLGKWLVATYSVAQVLLLRSAAALVVLAPFLWRGGVKALARAPLPGLQIVRILFSTLEVLCFYWAVAYMPLADVMTFYLAGPIWVAALAALFLGERLERARLHALFLGFVGVLVALRPSPATLSGPALIAIAGTFCFALMMITARQLRGTSDAVLVTGQMLGALVFGLAAAPFGWVTPSPSDAGLLCVLGVVSMVAHVCVNRSLKLAPASVVSPYQYTLIVWAAVLGYFVFGDVMQAWTVAGAALIIVAGWWLFRLEHRAAKTQFS